MFFDIILFMTLTILFLVFNTKFKIVKRITSSEELAKKIKKDLAKGMSSEELVENITINLQMKCKLIKLLISLI